MGMGMCVFICSILGSDAVLAQCRDNMSYFVSLCRYSHREVEIGEAIRQLANSTVPLVRCTLCISTHSYMYASINVCV